MIELLKEAYDRFEKYEMDVDSEAPLDHRQFMWRLKMVLDDKELYREYQKYEFCKAVNCPDLHDDHCRALYDEACMYTAKQFHSWLTKNGFKIIKE